MALNEGTGKGRAGDAGRDPGLDRAYAATERAEPPRGLDEAILAAAHREAGARPRALSALRAWRVPVSLAAVVVLSVTVVTLMHEEGGEELGQPPRPALSTEGAAPTEAAKPAPQDAPAAATESRAEARREKQNRFPHESPRRIQESAPAPAPAARPDARPLQGPPEGAAERPAAPSPAMDDKARAPAAIAERGPAPALSAPASETAAGSAPELRRQVPQAAPPPAPKALRSERDASAQQDSGGRGMAGATGSAPPVADPSQAMGEVRVRKGETSQVEPARMAALLKELEELDGRPPERWVERILELRRQGQRSEAGELLAEFRRRYPAHPLPPELQ